MKHELDRMAALGAFVIGMNAAMPASAVPVDQDFGTRAEDASAERVIKILPDAKWVNVNEGETVKFVDEASGQSFAWRFDTIVGVFELGRVAPPGMLEGHHVDAYVARSYRRQNNS